MTTASQSKDSVNRFIDSHQDRIEAALKDAVRFQITDQRKCLAEAIDYSVSAPAKRVRPLLCIASFLLFNSNVEKIMPIATAIEMVHSYSLIHDDLPAMDDDDFRRGQASCHKKFGEDIAILAGDTLNTYAFEVLATSLPQFYSAEKVLTIITELAKAFGIEGMAGGQVLDLKSEEGPRTLEYLQKTHALKTGKIIEACISLPAILESEDEGLQKDLALIGKDSGLLFQIVDDILDIKGSKESLGKSPQKDLEQNKLTYVSLLGLENAEKTAKELEAKIQARLSGLKGVDTDYLSSLIHYILERQG